MHANLELSLEDAVEMNAATVNVFLVDISQAMVAAWRETFENNPEVLIIGGSMLEQTVDAWVTPTNSRGLMDGGLDGVIKGRMGPDIERRVQAEIAQKFSGLLSIGHATCVPTGRDVPRYLISTPTMHSSAEDVSDTMNVALACGAAFQAVRQQNIALPGSIGSVALPGLGANTGKVPVEICADLMWTAYNLFRKSSFSTFSEMRAALEAELGELGPTSGVANATPLNAGSGPPVLGTNPSTAPDVIPLGPSTNKPAKEADVDFDDFDDNDGNGADSTDKSPFLDDDDDFDDF